MCIRDRSQVNFWQPLWNSLIVALGSGILGIAVGGTVAWFITRSDLKCKKFISAVFVFPYMMPAWTLALFWTNMFQNSQVGGGNIGMVESIFGVCMPEWFVYGLFPMIVVTGLHYSPFAYLLIGGILKNMDATLEESATILKASRATIIRRVTIPIVMPAILSTFLLIFSSGFSSYTVPVFLGSAAVSYTHLDVYKRQVKHIGKQEAHRKRHFFLHQKELHTQLSREIAGLHIVKQRGNVRPVHICLCAAHALPERIRRAGIAEIAHGVHRHLASADFHACLLYTSVHQQDDDVLAFRLPERIIQHLLIARKGVLRVARHRVPVKPRVARVPHQRLDARLICRAAAGKAEQIGRKGLIHLFAHCLFKTRQIAQHKFLSLIHIYTSEDTNG